MTEEYQTIVKRIIIRVVDAMGLWKRSEEGDSAAAEAGEVKNPPIPTWEEKEMAVINYMASYKGLLTLATIIDTQLRQKPEQETFQFVTRVFVQNAVGIIVDYANARFPDEKEKFEAEQKEARAQAAREKLKGKSPKDQKEEGGDLK